MQHTETTSVAGFALADGAEQHVVGGGAYRPVTVKLAHMTFVTTFS